MYNADTDDDDIPPTVGSTTHNANVLLNMTDYLLQDERPSTSRVNQPRGVEDEMWADIGRRAANFIEETLSPSSSSSSANVEQRKATKRSSGSELFDEGKWLSKKRATSGYKQLLPGENDLSLKAEIVKKYIDMITEKGQQLFPKGTTQAEKLVCYLARKCAEELCSIGKARMGMSDLVEYEFGLKLGLDCSMWFLPSYDARSTLNRLCTGVSKNPAFLFGLTVGVRRSGVCGGNQFSFELAYYAELIEVCSHLINITFAAVNLDLPVYSSKLSAQLAGEKVRDAELYMLGMRRNDCTLDCGEYFVSPNTLAHVMKEMVDKMSNEVMAYQIAKPKVWWTEPEGGATNSGNIMDVIVGKKYVPSRCLLCCVGYNKIGGALNCVYEHVMSGLYVCSSNCLVKKQPHTMEPHGTFTGYRGLMKWTSSNATTCANHMRYKHKYTVGSVITRLIPIQLMITKLPTDKFVSVWCKFHQLIDEEVYNTEYISHIGSSLGKDTEISLDDVCLSDEFLMNIM